MAKMQKRVGFLAGASMSAIGLAMMTAAPARAATGIEFIETGLNNVSIANPLTIGSLIDRAVTSGIHAQINNVSSLGTINVSGAGSVFAVGDGVRVDTNGKGLVTVGYTGSLDSATGDGIAVYSTGTAGGGINVTTAAGQTIKASGIYLNETGVGIEIRTRGTGDVNVTNAAAISSSGAAGTLQAGIEVVNAGTGNIAIANTGTIGSATDRAQVYGIAAETDTATTPGTIRVSGSGNIFSFDSGIVARPLGSGLVDVNYTGNIDSATGNGILVNAQTTFGGPVTITTGNQTIGADDAGIWVLAGGPGSVTINNNATIRSSLSGNALTNGVEVLGLATGTGSILIDNDGTIGSATDRAQNNGIHAKVINAVSTGAINVTGTGDVFSIGDGINVDTVGKGAVTVDYAGSINASNGDAIEVTSTDVAAGAVNVRTAAGETLKASSGSGIRVASAGSGGVSVSNLSAISSGAGGLGTLATGIDVIETGTAPIVINNDAPIGSLADRATISGINAQIANAASTGTVTVTGSGAIFSTTSGIAVGTDALGGVTVDYTGAIDNSAGPGIIVSSKNSAGGDVNVTTGSQTIKVSGGNGIAVDAAGTGNVSIVNGATISSSGLANTLNGGISAFTTGTGNVSISNSGDIGTAGDRTQGAGISASTDQGGTASVTGSGDIFSLTTALQARSLGTGSATVDYSGNIDSATGFGVFVGTTSGDQNITLDGNVTAAGANQTVRAVTQSGAITYGGVGNIFNTGLVGDGLSFLITGAGSLDANVGGSISVDGIPANAITVASSSTDGGDVHVRTAAGETLLASGSGINISTAGVGTVTVDNAALILGQGTASTVDRGIAITQDGTGNIAINNDGVIGSLTERAQFSAIEVELKNATSPGTIGLTGAGDLFSLGDGTDAVEISSNGLGAISIDYAGSIDAANGNAIDVESSNGAGDAVTVRTTGAAIKASLGSGILVNSAGTGGVRVANSSAISSSLGTGTLATGITVVETGTGNVDIANNGDIGSTTDRAIGEGIHAEIANTGSPGTIGVSGTGDIFAGTDGIFATTDGTGAITVNYAGSVDASGGDAIEVLSTNANGGAINVTTAAGETLKAGAGSTGILVNTQGPGNVTVDNSADISLSGTLGPLGNGIYVDMAGAGAIDINNDGVIGSLGARANQGIYATIDDRTSPASINITGSGAIFSINEGIEAITVGTGPLTIDYSGAIDTTVGDGIYAETASGDQSITVDGNITAGGNGVYVRTVSGTVTYSGVGDITTLGAGTDGIYFDLQNGSLTANVGGSITTANGDAIEVLGADAGPITVTTAAGETLSVGNGNGIIVQTTGLGDVTIDNAADIIRNPTTAGPLDYGIYAYSSGDGRITIDNSGTIGSLTDRADYGIYAQDLSSAGGLVTITGTGDLFAATDGINVDTYSNPITINYSGSIDALDDAIEVYASDNDAGAISITTAAGETLKADDVGIFVQTYGAGGVTINNAANISSSSALGTINDGIYVSMYGTGGVTIDNDGTIGAANDRPETAIYAYEENAASGPIAITGSGSIYALNEGIYALINGGPGTITVNYDGAINASLGDGIRTQTQSGDQSIQVDGDITAGSSGVYAETDSGHIAYSGTGNITAVDNGLYFGIYGAGSLDAILGGNVSASAGDAIEVLSVDPTGGAIDISTTAGKTLTASGGSGILVNSAGSGLVSIDNNAAISSGGTGMLVSGISVYETGTGAIAINDHGPIGSATDRATTNGILASIANAASTGSITVYGTGDIFSVLDGIDVTTDGLGDVIVNYSGSVDSSTGSAINVLSTNVNGGPIDITTAAGEFLKNAANGILVQSAGPGNVTINNDAAIASSGALGTFQAGIEVLTNATATGNIDITNNGNIGSLTDRAATSGIHAVIINAASAGTIDFAGTGDVFSVNDGLHAETAGTGAITIGYAGSVDASAGNAISAFSDNPAGGAITVSTVAGETLKASGGGGILAQAAGTGDIVVTNNAAMSSSGTAGTLAFGINVIETGTGSIDITNNGAIGSLTDRTVGDAIQASINNLNSNGTIDVTGSGALFAASNGLSIGTNGMGAVTVNYTGAIDAVGAGISVDSTNAAGGPITVTTGTQTISADGTGIKIDTSGSGDVTVLNNASIGSSGGPGILTDGIAVADAGTGSIDITNIGNIGSLADRLAGNGIRATITNNTSAGTIDVSGTGDIFSVDDGIQAQTAGTGAMTINYSGSVDASAGDAISAFTDNLAGGAITVTTAAGETLKASNGDGIDVETSGTGDVTVTNNAAIVSSSAAAGPLNHGIDVNTFGTGDLTVVNNGAIGTATDRAVDGGVSAIIDNTASIADINVTGSGDVFSVNDGIFALTTGTGAITVNYSGAISVTGGNGIDVLTTSGAQTITVGGNVTASDTGIKGFSTSGPITVSVTGGNVTGGNAGVDLGSSGAMSVTIASGSSVTGGTAATPTTAINATGTGALTVANSGTLGFAGGTAVLSSLANATAISNLAGGVMNGRVDLSDLVDTVVNSGTWNASGANNFYLGTDSVTNNASGIINTVAGTSFTGLETMTNAGRININGNLAFTGVATDLTNTGRIDVNSGATTGLGTFTNNGLLNMNGTSTVSGTTFTQGATGNIVFALTPAAAGNQPLTSYPHVLATTANLAGTLTANITTLGSVVFNDLFYDDVIDATTRNGTFNSCVASYNGVVISTGSLLSMTCIYDATGNVDLGFTRTGGFGEVDGLNENAQSVGDGLDCITEDDAPTGGMIDLLGDLLVIVNDPEDYNDALNMLAGEGYANYLQSFASLGVRYNDIADKASSCEVPALAGSVLECRETEGVHVWGQLDHQWRNAKGDIEAGTTDAKRLSTILGFDKQIGQSGLIGAMAGMVDNDTDEHRFGQSVKGKGYVFGGYALYDPGTFYVKALGTYSLFDGDSSRRIDLAPYGGTFAASIGGDPDVNMWTVGLHAGARIATSKTSVLTPYLNIDHVDAKLDQFVEQTTGGDEGAELTVLGGTSKHTFLTGGVKWAGKVGGLVPEVNLGYRYRLGDKRASFSACFDGDPDCAFDIVSAAEKRGSFLAGLNVGGKLGPVDVRVSYEGEFNSDVTSHSANLKLVVPLGGRKH